MSIEASVIVCTFRRNQVLCDTINHLREQLGENAELLVVDQRADHDESTKQFLAEMVNDQRIRYFDLPEPGLTRARNFGAEMSLGHVLIYCDDDIIPSERLIEEHLANYHDEIVAAVAGQVLHGDEVPMHRPGHFAHDSQIVDFDALYGANFSIRKSVFQSIGGADEKLGIHAYTEDVLLARALQNAGQRIQYCPKASVLHLQHGVGGCRITDQSQPTGESERVHSKLYLYHKMRDENSPERRRVLWHAIRQGPLRKQNIVRFWRQPGCWISFIVAYQKAKQDAIGG